MRIVCRANKGADLPTNLLAQGGFGNATTEFPLERGKEYVVYAMCHISGRCLEYVVDAEGPYAAFAPLFDVTDGRVSRYWTFGHEKHRVGVKDVEFLSSWGYPEFVQEPSHRLSLFEMSRTATDVFRKYKELMDLEFPDPRVKNTARHLENEWMMCPNCSNAWESGSQDGLLRCPGCSERLLNPRYSGQ